MLFCHYRFKEKKYIYVYTFSNPLRKFIYFIIFITEKIFLINLYEEK